MRIKEMRNKHQRCETLMIRKWLIPFFRGVLEDCPEYICEIEGLLLLRCNDIYV